MRTGTKRSVDARYGIITSAECRVTTMNREQNVRSSSGSFGTRTSPSRKQLIDASDGGGGKFKVMGDVYFFNNNIAFYLVVIVQLSCFRLTVFPLIKTYLHCLHKPYFSNVHIHFYNDILKYSIIFNIIVKSNELISSNRLTEIQRDLVMSGKLILIRNNNDV